MKGPQPEEARAKPSAQAVRIVPHIDDVRDDLALKSPRANGPGEILRRCAEGMSAAQDTVRPMRETGHELGHRASMKRHDEPSVQAPRHPAHDILDDETASSVDVHDHHIDAAMLLEQGDGHVQETAVPVGRGRGSQDGIAGLQEMLRQPLALRHHEPGVPADHRSEKTQSRAHGEVNGRIHLLIWRAYGEGDRTPPGWPAPVARG